jgi:hypothetical protein
MRPRLRASLQCAAVCAIALPFLVRMGISDASHPANEQRPLVADLPPAENRCCLFFGDEYEAAEHALESLPVEPQPPTF